MHEETHFSISTYLFQNQTSLVWKKIAQLSTWKLYWESCIFATDRPKNFWHSWGEWNLTLFWEVNVLLSFLSALIMGIVVKRFIKGVFLTPFFIQICIMVEKSSKLHFRARDLNRWKPMKNSLKCSSPSQWWRAGGALHFPVVLDSSCCWCHRFFSSGVLYTRSFDFQFSFARLPGSK